MKTKFSFIMPSLNLLLVLLFSAGQIAFAAEPMRIACVGDSITFGAAIKDRQANCYPTQLGRLLGARATVRNFGVNGATLLKKGDNPYWRQGAYRNALAFKPDLVVIKLGTNDSKPQNWKHKAGYVADYVALIKSFQELESKPKVWVCYPVPAYPGRWGITDKVMKEEVIPLIDKVADQAGVRIIDLYAALSNKKDMFPDRVHPNAAGAKVMVKTISKALASSLPKSAPK
jgi:lysophospholipase L1-like esterase